MHVVGSVYSYLDGRKRAIAGVMVALVGLSAALRAAGVPVPAEVETNLLRVAEIVGAIGTAHAVLKSRRP